PVPHLDRQSDAPSRQIGVRHIEGIFADGLLLLRELVTRLFELAFEHGERRAHAPLFAGAPRGGRAIGRLLDRRANALDWRARRVELRGEVLAIERRPGIERDEAAYEEERVVAFVFERDELKRLAQAVHGRRRMRGAFGIRRARAGRVTE